MKYSIIFLITMLFGSFAFAQEEPDLPTTFLRIGNEKLVKGIKYPKPDVLQLCLHPEKIYCQMHTEECNYVMEDVSVTFQRNAMAKEETIAAGLKSEKSKEPVIKIPLKNAPLVPGFVIRVKLNKVYRYTAAGVKKPIDMHVTTILHSFVIKE